MDLEADIKWIHNELSYLSDPKLVRAIKNLLENRKQTAANRISSEQYDRELNKSMAQIKSGHTLTSEEIKSRLDQWVGK